MDGLMKPKPSKEPPPVVPAGSHEEAAETARLVGFSGGLGSLITRES